MRKSTACSIATVIVAMTALGGTSPAGAGLLPVNADAMRSADADQITDAHSNDGGNALFAGAALGSIGPGVVDYYHPYYRRHYYRAHYYPRYRHYYYHGHYYYHRYYYNPLLYHYHRYYYYPHYYYPHYYHPGYYIPFWRLHFGIWW
jgi:hypothetical protein